MAPSGTSAWPEGVSWTPEELHAELSRKNADRVHLIRVLISPTDVNPVQARQQTIRSRRLQVALGVIALAFLAVSLGWRVRAEGFAGLVFPVAWMLFIGFNTFRGRGRVWQPTAGAQGAAFVDALVSSTQATRAVRDRWLAFTTAADAQIVTQEVRWDYGGPHPVLAVRWTAADGRITDVSDRNGNGRFVDLTFADGSEVRLELSKSQRRALLEAWPAG